MKRIVWYSIIITVFLCACNLSGLGDSGAPNPPQIRILSIKVRPDTVAPGDTASFTCVFVDSSLTNLKFFWYIPKGTAIGGKDTTYAGNQVYLTLRNHIRWKAPTQPGNYSFTVFEDNGTKGTAPSGEGFGVLVK